MTAEASVPLRIGTEQLARTLRETLDRAGFLERVIGDRLGMATLEAVGLPLFKSFADRITGAGALEPLVRLFLFGELVGADTMRVHFGGELDAFFDADLIRYWNQPGVEQIYSPVRLVPIRTPHRGSDLRLACDRVDAPDGSAVAPFKDVVFPGHTPLTREFLRLLPSSPCASVLDLCAGTGAGALDLAGVAARCTAADIAPRSAHFSAFNRWLNGCGAVEVVCGNLYEPVAGRRFDRVVAHPPYVPALADRLTFRDGGETGDAIVRGVIEGLPQHLSEGGTFHVLCLAMDTGAGPFEQRARQWLGASDREFDVVFALDSRTPPELIATRLADRGGGSTEDLNRWRDLFVGNQVQQFVYGGLAGRRFQWRPGAEAFTRRVLLTDDCTGDGFEWLFRWFDWMRLPDRDERIMASTPRLPADLRLEVRHRVEGNSFVPNAFALINGGRPFLARLETEAWVAALLGELDGARSVRSVFESAKARGRVPTGFGDADVAQLFCYLAERRCVEGMAA